MHSARSHQRMTLRGFGQLLKRRAVLHPAIGVQPNVEVEPGHVAWDVGTSREGLEPLSRKRTRIIPADRNDSRTAALHRIPLVGIKAHVEADHLKFKRCAVSNAL